MGPMHSSATFAATERQELAALLRRLGPTAPTCCDGWDTFDLVTHLYLREHRLDAALGMFVSALSPRLERVTNELKTRGFEYLVQRWQQGLPPALSRLEPVLNTLENFVHHEDVRRAQENWQPRSFELATLQQLDAPARRLLPLLLRRSTVPVVVEAAGLPRWIAHDRRGVVTKGNAVAHLRGPLPEIILWAYGRPTVVQVLFGPEEYLSQVRRSSI